MLLSRTGSSRHSPLHEYVLLLRPYLFHHVIRQVRFLTTRARLKTTGRNLNIASVALVNNTVTPSYDAAAFPHVNNRRVTHADCPPASGPTAQEFMPSGHELKKVGC